METVLWQVTRSPDMAGRALPLGTFDRPMPPISTVLAEVERTYSGNRVRPPTQYIRGKGDDVVGVHEEPEDVVSNLELSFDCCLQKLVERRWEGFLRRFTLSWFDEDWVEDECEFLMFLIVVLGVDESLMEYDDGGVRGESLFKEGNGNGGSEDVKDSFFFVDEWD